MRTLITRFVDAILLLWIVTTLTFALIHLAPGDPATLLVSPTATAEEIARTRAALGLDTPLPVQYGRWVGAMLRGDLGFSFSASRPVTDVIRDALPVSLFLGGCSLALSFALGIALGGVQARRPGSAVDTTVSAIATAAYAAPSFWLALALVALATSGASAVNAPAWLRLPAFGMTEPAALSSGLALLRDLTRHALLPVLVLSIPGAAGVARYARQALTDARMAPHVAAASARGLSTRTIDRRYVLRNAWSPLIVLFGLMLPGVIAGSVFVEQVFAWPGLGRTMLLAIAARDYPVVLGLTMLYAATVILANLMADLVIVRLDPRRRS